MSLSLGISSTSLIRIKSSSSAFVNPSKILFLWLCSILSVLSIILFVFSFFSLYSQELVQIGMGPSYEYDIYYSFDNGITAYPERANWELAFSTDLYDGNIRINSGAPVYLYEIAHGSAKDSNEAVLFYLYIFILFRYFDIKKPFPVSFFDKKFKNSFGVIMDDVVAGLYVVLTLIIFMVIKSKFF